MKDRIKKALYVSIVTSLGITLVYYVRGESISFGVIPYMIVAFMVDMVFPLFFDKNNK